jgi:uncharacterized protein YdbL (DUF1318 family)
MKIRGIRKWIFAGTCAILAACANITINVYFPEKDVKQAYKSLDDMLLHQEGGDKAPAPAAPENGPAEKKEDPVKPQSRLVPEGISISFISTACAAENVADDLAIEISSAPEVVKAYDEMRGRLPQLNALRQNGAVGETNQGLVSVRDKAKGAAAEPVVKAENNNRKTVITAMAKAILKINRQDTKKIPGNVMAQAAAVYADSKREAAKPGWWIQLANGNWVQK